MLSTLAASVVAVWTTKHLMRSLEERAFADVGLQWNRDGRWSLWLGLVVGFAAAVIAVLIPVAMGLAAIRAATFSKADLRNFVFLVIIFSVQPLGEELVSRGYPFQVLIRRYGFVAAVLGTSFVFAAAHLPNAGASAFSFFSTFLIGVVLACAVCRSGSLWLPVGIHTGWNVALPFLGVNLSGTGIRMTRFELEGCTDTLWCGGTYGVEASLPTMLIYAVMLVGIWYIPSSAPQWFERQEVDGPKADAATAGTKFYFVRNQDSSLPLAFGKEPKWPNCEMSPRPVPLFVLKSVTPSTITVSPGCRSENWIVANRDSSSLGAPPAFVSSLVVR